MARVDENDVTLGLRGKFGKQFVFRKFLNRTIAVRKSRPTGGNTQAQSEHRDQFRLATLYAKRCLLQPALKAEYELIARATDQVSAFAAAVGDYLKPVAITAVVTVTYKGEAGYPLGILVNDLFKVKTMKVTISDAAGNILESGDAMLSEGAVGYTYITTVSIPDVTGLVIKVEVTDRPGNIVAQEVTL
jgi:hypothetical protein